MHLWIKNELNTNDDIYEESKYDDKILLMLS